MRLFLAREALDPHLRLAGPVLNSRFSTSERLSTAIRAGAHYAVWYPLQWWPLSVSGSDFAAPLRGHLRFAARTSRRLARTLFHAMLRYGPKLEKQQLLLGRFVDIGTELFAIAAACSRAQSLGTTEALDLADYFCRSSRLKVADLFRHIRHNEDRCGYRLAQRLLTGEFSDK